MKKTSKKKNQKTKLLLDIINNPRTIIIVLILVLVALTIAIVHLRSSYKFYAGELIIDDLKVAEIHYFESPNTVYFYADNTIYEGQDTKVKDIKIKYYVKANDNKYIIDEFGKEFKDPINLSEAIVSYSKFKVVQYKVNKKIVFTDVVKKNINNLYFNIEATTTDNKTITYDERISLLRVNQ